jgi:hypothetical protein
MTTDLRDSIYLQEIKARGMLGDVCVIDPSLEILKLSQDKDYIKNLFLEIKQPFAGCDLIKPQDNIRELMLNISYPVQFFDYNIDAYQREVYSASNFVNFYRQAQNIFKNNHIVAIIDKNFYGQVVHHDHYLFENKQIKHSWSSHSYLSPYDKLSFNNTITVMPKNQFPDRNVDFVATQIAEKLQMTNDIISLSYFRDKETNQIAYIDLSFGGNVQAMPLFQKASTKFIEARLTIYGFKYIQERGKTPKSSYFYMSGKQKFQSLISMNVFYQYHKNHILSYFKAIPVLPLLDSDDLNPFAYLIFRLIKTSPFTIYTFLRSKFKKLYTDYTIAQNRKKFSQFNI